MLNDTSFIETGRVPLIPAVMITQCISFAKFWSQPYAPEVSNNLCENITKDKA